MRCSECQYKYCSIQYGTIIGEEEEEEDDDDTFGYDARFCFEIKSCSCCIFVGRFFSLVLVADITVCGLVVDVDVDVDVDVADTDNAAVAVAVDVDVVFFAVVVAAVV